MKNNLLLYKCSIFTHFKNKNILKKSTFREDLRNFEETFLFKLGIIEEFWGVKITLNNESLQIFRQEHIVCTLLQRKASSYYSRVLTTNILYTYLLWFIKSWLHHEINFVCLTLLNNNVLDTVKFKIIISLLFILAFLLKWHTIGLTGKCFPTSHMYSLLTPSVTSVVRTNFPSNGPNHVPCGILLIAHAPNRFPGTLDVHRDTSSGTRIFLGDSGGVSGNLWHFLDKSNT